MAKRSSKVVKAYANHVELSGYSAGVQFSLEQTNADIETLGDVGPRALYSSYGYNISVNGFFDAASPSLIDASQWAYLGAVTPIAVLWEGNVEGGIAYEGLYVITSQPREAAIGEAIVTNIEASGSDTMGRGVVLGSATVTGVSNRPGQNMGATTAGQILIATFRVVGGTFSSITMAVQESSNDGAGDAYANISGLTSGALSSVGVVRVSTSAATEAWKRVAVSAFTGTNAIILVTLTLEAETN